MINLEHKHLIAILRSKAFNFSGDYFNNESINNKVHRRKWKELTDSEFDEIYNGVCDYFCESAPIVYEIEGGGDFGPFPIEVHGVRGAYFCWAPDFGYEGPFDTKAEAIGKIGYYY